MQTGRCSATPLRVEQINIRPYEKNEYMSSISPKCNELSTIIRAFKSATTKRINGLYHSVGEKFWQSNYYEHIIRNNHSPITSSTTPQIGKMTVFTVLQFL
jgi:REP element-mobilizing transposase RayT